MGGEPARQDKPKVEPQRAERRATPLVVQKKLQVGRADDPLEREADEAARLVVAMSRAPQPGASAAGRVRSGAHVARSHRRDPDGNAASPRVRRAAASSAPARTAGRRVQRAATIGAEGGPLDADTEDKLQSARRRSGAALEGPLQERIGDALGADVSGVRLHDGTAARHLNERMSAKAFTVGNDVFFRDGVPDTGSSSGLGLLAHEVAHTVQQGASPVSRTTDVQRILDTDLEDDVIEVEAEKRRNALVNHRIESPTGGRLDPNDPRMALLDGFVGDRQGKGPDHDPVREQKFVDFMGREGERATTDAQTTVQDDGSKQNAQTSMGEVMWARGLAGGDQQKASELLRLYHALPEPAFKTFLTQHVNDAGKLAFAGAQLAVLGPGFTERRFDLLYSHQNDLAALGQLLTGPPQWTVEEITAILTGPPALSAPHQSKLLALCVQRAWTKADASALFGGLAKPCAEVLCDSVDLQSEVVALAATWTLAGAGEVLGEVWKKKPDAVVAAQFLHAAADIGFSRDEAKALLTGLAGPKLVVVAQSQAVQAQLKALKPAWTNVGQMAQVVAKFLNKSNDAAQLATFLAFCASGPVSSADADKWVAALSAPVLTGFVTTVNLRTAVTALLPTWTDATKSAQLLVAFHTKKPDFEVMAKFLTCCKLRPWSTVDSRKLVDGLAEPILTGIAGTNELQNQLKAVTATWTDFTKMAQLLTAFHAKEATFTILAKYLKGCGTHTWTQDNARKLVDGLTQPPLKELSETDDLILKVHEIGQAVWTDFAKIAKVIEEAHKAPERMTAADKSEFLVLCKQDAYLPDRAEKFITVSKRAAGYTWPERFVQVRNFRGHAQPANGTNDLGGGFNTIRNFPSNGHQIYLGMPNNKVRHVKDGHSYEAFWFSVQNCHRYGGVSSMFAKGTSIPTKVIAAATGNTHVHNAAFAAGPTQDSTAADYTIAYTKYGQDLTKVPPEIAVAVSQFYPKGGWVAHELKGDLAEGIGRLKGYIT